MIRYALFLLMLAGSAAWASAPEAARTQSPIPAKVVASPFPDLAGWQRSEPIKRFAPDKLYEYINGASESFLAFAFQELLVAEYVRPDKASVVVEIYRHKSPLHAFGIYSQEKSSQGDFLKIGAEGYLSVPILNFIMGDTYIKLSAYDLGEASAETLRLFARKMESTLSGSRTLPQQLGCFPAVGKVPNSERFMLENLMGYEFLHSGFTADYQEAGQSFQLLLIQGTDRKDCEVMLGKFLQTIPQPKPELKEGRYTLRDPNQGELSLIWKGKYICAVLHQSDPKVRDRYLTLMEAQVQALK